MATRYVIGIDEVGRGALAGPVVVAAAMIPKGFRIRPSHNLSALKDSKKLSPAYREAWYARLVRHPALRYATARVSPRVIDRVNISRAANIAALRACVRLMGTARMNPGTVSVVLDGGLFLGVRREGLWKSRTVTRGDEQYTAIKIASIIAKVSRDRMMRRSAAKYPGYGLEVHKGYGTAMHKKALRAQGPSVIHRATFL